MFKKLFFSTFLTLATYFATGQNITGLISDEQTKIPLPGVNVYWAGTSTGTTTDVDGRFSIPFGESHTLVSSMVGYTPDSTMVHSPGSNLEIRLKPSLNMQTVVVEEEQSVFTLSTMSLLNTEAINRGVLRKAACCNLSETFESTATVDVVMNDALTGARKIQMLGLEGVYVQNLFEGIPFTRGLGNMLGFDQIPGPWINSIQLSKGLGSVINGYESMIGQINLEFIQPCALEAVRFDLFASNQGRYESNLVWNKQIGSSWSTGLFAGVHVQNMHMDVNNDGFLDMPLRDGIKLMNRWKYEGDLFRMELMGSYTYEDRTSGQTTFNHEEDFGTHNSYGFGLSYEQAEVLGKFGFFAPNREDRSFGITTIYSYNDADAFFGHTEYEGTQVSARINAIYQSQFAKISDHSYKAGVHFLYDDYSEVLADSAFMRTEYVPGVFAEYTWERPRFTLVAGARADFHNLFGNQFTPRVHLKYNPSQNSTIRGTAGRGFRTPNAYADQIGLLASSRRVQVLNTPQAEVNWNTGISYLQKFKINGRDASFNTDYFYTWFENQLVIDRDASPQLLRFYNLEGRSFAHSFQTDLQYNVVKGMEVKFSYKYQHVQTDYLIGRLEKPMIPKHRALVNVAYKTNDERWYFDLTGNYYGTMRLPDTQSNPEPFRLNERSQGFLLFNAQVTWVWKGFDFYTGVENIGNFIQANAIVDPENPFGENFDATMIYGPLNGRMYYVGARMNLKTRKK
jgi:outer membrane cobalamin receptor